MLKKKNGNSHINHWAVFFFFLKKCFFGTPVRLSISKHLRVSIRLSAFGSLVMTWGRLSNNQLITACYPAGLLVDCRGFLTKLKKI
jgi:hypothetical protein